MALRTQTIRTKNGFRLRILASQQKHTRIFPKPLKLRMCTAEASVQGRYLRQVINDELIPIPILTTNLERLFGNCLSKEQLLTALNGKKDMISKLRQNTRYIRHLTKDISVLFAETTHSKYNQCLSQLKPYLASVTHPKERDSLFFRECISSMLHGRNGIGNMLQILACKPGDHVTCGCRMHCKENMPCIWKIISWRGKRFVGQERGQEIEDAATIKICHKMSVL